MPSLVEIGPVVLKKVNMWKIYDKSDVDNDNDDDDGQWTNFEKLTWTFSSGEVKIRNGNAVG